MFDTKFLDEMAARISEAVKSSPAKDLEKNVRALLASLFSRLDLVTREEFEVQAQVLLRTREKLEQLEQRLSALEEPPAPPPAA
jgi:BMFP domain-containing protein YqiC